MANVLRNSLPPRPHYMGKTKLKLPQKWINLAYVLPVVGNSQWLTDDSVLNGMVTGDARLTSTLLIKCLIKYYNEQNPHHLLKKFAKITISNNNWTSNKMMPHRTCPMTMFHQLKGGVWTYVTWSKMINQCFDSNEPRSQYWLVPEHKVLRCRTKT